MCGGAQVNVRLVNASGKRDDVGLNKERTCEAKTFASFQLPSPHSTIPKLIR